MLSLFVGGALGLAVQPQQAGSMQASPDPAASPSPAAQVQGVGFDWASGAKLPEGATAVPLAAPAAVPATAAAPVAEAPPPTAVAQVPEFVQPEAPVAPTAVAVAPTAADGTQQPVATASCVSLQPGTSDYWCSTTCATSVCPETMCKCGDGAQQQAAAKVDAAIEKHQENEQKVKDAAQAIASSPLPVAPAAAAAPVVDADHADAEQKVKDAMGAKSKEDADAAAKAAAATAAQPADSIIGAHDAAEQKVKDAMGATVDQIKDKVAGEAAALASPAPLVQAPAPEAVAVAPEPVAVAPEAEAKKGEKLCTSLVPTATDQWCQNTCSEVPSQIVAVTPTSYCPKEICSCK